MPALTLHDVKSLDDYERIREEIRQAIIQLKLNRRIALGDWLTLVFENRDTVWFQIQEMVRAERIVDAKKIQEEIEIYNELLPSADELSATLFIEVTEASRVKEILDSFKGLDRGETVWLQVGPHRVYGAFEEGHSKEEKISAVHFVRFRIAESMKAAMRDLQMRMTLGINHADYRAMAPIPDEMRLSLLMDLDM